MKTNNRRLIASMIATFAMSTTIVGFGLGTYSYFNNINANRALSNIESQQNEIVEFVKSSSVYQNEYNYMLNMYSNQYTNNEISFDEYNSYINYLNSNQFINDCINKYGNNDLREDFHLLQLQHNDAQHIISISNNATNVGFISCIGGAITTGPLFAYSMYKSNKKMREDNKLC